MKYLRLRYIIPTILTVILVIFLGLYFIGGLTASAKMKYDNEEFDESLFMDASDFAVSNAELVANNGTYSMFFDELTTIVTVVLNSSCTAPSAPNPSQCSVVYKTADATSSSAQNKSNILLSYFMGSGKIQSKDFNTWENSVQYVNYIEGVTERHYKFSYSYDEYVDVLYEIGDFTNVYSYFPEEFDRATYDDLFRGNLIFLNDKDVTSTDSEGRIILKYRTSGIQGYTYSSECAAYLEENGLATVTEEKDINGNSYGYYSLTDAIDANGRPKAKIGVNYNTTALEGEKGYSPCTSNPFTIFDILDKTIYASKSYELEMTSNGDTSNTLEINTNYYVENSSQTFKFKASTATLVIQELIKYMYTIDENYLTASDINKNLTTEAQKNAILYYDYKGDGNYEKFKIGGFQAKDEEGRWLYDEDGNPVQTAFTKEMVDEQNALFGNTEAAETTSIQVGLRFRLTEDGFKVTILNNSISEETQAKIYQIKLLPNFTVNSNKTSEGQIIVPDGSGAIISFNSVKDSLYADGYSKKIYGTDYTIPLKEMANQNEDIMFGMYGFLDFTEKKGIVAIIDKGASLSWLEADFLRLNRSDSNNYARFITDMRTYEEVSLSSGNSFKKWTSSIYPGDIVYEYRFLGEDELSYVDVANTYREYLLEKYSDVGLTEGGDTTTVHTPTLQFLGAFEKKVLTLGIVHKKDYSLTTFDQAIDILEELQENGLENANVSYLYWTKDAVEAELTKNPKANSVLGGKKGLTKLNEYLTSCGFDFYPSANITVGQGYDYSFGSLKYSPKSVTSEYSTISQFVASTGLANSDFKPAVLLSPRFYEAYINNYLKKYDKYAIKGVYAWDLGNQKAGDYSKKNLTYTETASMYQQNVLSILQKDDQKIMLSSAYDYALPYASVVTNVPLTATMLTCVDYSIPLYQLVISGLVDYSMESINYENDNTATWYFLKALETGSNLSFTLSAEDTKILLDTNYTDNYGAYYLNWKHKIISLNKQLNELGIYKSRLVSHEYISDNVVKVEYANGLKLMINFDDDTYQDKASGQAIASNWYIVLEEGK